MQKGRSKLISTETAHPISLKSLIKSFWYNRHLTMQLIKREVVGRYKGAVLGLLWSFLYPLLMLIVFTFVFSVVFKARWGMGDEETKIQFAIILYAGLIVHGFFSEVLNRAAGLIIANVNYVKKIVFPLEILPGVVLGAAFFHGLVSFFVLMCMFWVVNGFINWTVVFVPLVLFPLVILTFGVACIVASLGVFLRDVGQVTNIITMLMLFGSPIFFPISALPSSFQPWILCNPLTFIVEQTRAIIIWGHAPDWFGLFFYWVISMIMAWVGYVWFQKTRKGFADVL